MEKNKMKRWWRKTKSNDDGEKQWYDDTVIKNRSEYSSLSFDRLNPSRTEDINFFTSMLKIFRGEKQNETMMEKNKMKRWWRKTKWNDDRENKIKRWWRRKEEKRRLFRKINLWWWRNGWNSLVQVHLYREWGPSSVEEEEDQNQLERNTESKPIGEKHSTFESGAILPKASRDPFWRRHVIENDRIYSHRSF